MQQLFSILLDGEPLGHYLETQLTKTNLINHVWTHYQHTNAPTNLASLVDAEREPYFSSCMWDYVLLTPKGKTRMTLVAKAMKSPQKISGHMLYRLTHSYHVQPHHFDCDLEFRGVRPYSSIVETQRFNALIPLEDTLKAVYPAPYGARL